MWLGLSLLLTPHDLYKEIEVPLDHPIISELDKMRSWISSKSITISGRPDRRNLSSDSLKKRKDGFSNQAYLYKFNRENDFSFTRIEELVQQVYQEHICGEYEFISVARTWYPKGGYLGWHTDNDGGRLYATWANGKSFFRYQDPTTGKIITSWDKPKQWTFRIFTFDSDNPLWHCVGAEDIRISIGYRFVHTSKC